MGRNSSEDVIIILKEKKVNGGESGFLDTRLESSIEILTALKSQHRAQTNACALILENYFSMKINKKKNYI